MSDGDVLAVLHDLQSQLSFQEDTLSALNDALAAQQQEILVLRRQLELLKQRQDEHSAQSGQATQRGEPPPPHY